MLMATMAMKYHVKTSMKVTSAVIMNIITVYMHMIAAIAVILAIIRPIVAMTLLTVIIRPKQLLLTVV